MRSKTCDNELWTKWNNPNCTNLNYPNGKWYRVLQIE